MKQTKPLSDVLFLSVTALVCVVLFTIFTKCNDSSGTITTKDTDVTGKIDAAISCTANGFTVADSTLYMHNGGIEFKKTIVDQQDKPNATPAGMVWIPGGEFSMGGVDPVGMQEGGSESMNDARPAHRVHVRGFFMDATEVTNKEFALFVHATGYKTVAETKPTKEEFPTAPEENLVAGSVVFTPTPVADLNDHYQWWDYIHGADWKHPRDH
jgi:formylglycine-generating enzyme required for sulfatase activity